MKTPGVFVQFRSRVLAPLSGAAASLTILRRLRPLGSGITEGRRRLTALVLAAGLFALAPSGAAQVLQPGDLQPQAMRPSPAIDTGIRLSGPDGLPAVLSPADAERYREIFATHVVED